MKPGTLSTSLVGPSKWVRGEAAYLNSWVAENGGGQAWTGSYEAIGLARDGVVVGGLVFYDFNGVNCSVNIAITDPSVFRKLLRLGFGYVFGQLGAHRLTFLVSSGNLASIRLVLGLGAVHEATLREAGKEKVDLHIYALFQETCLMWSRLSGKIGRPPGTS